MLQSTLKNKKTRVAFQAILITLLVFYFCNSFNRYYNFYLDGDLAPVVLPAPSYELVLKDPFGLNVILNDSVYAATNRYFSHLFLSIYFKSAPEILQTFFSPIDSVYISCAIAKTCIHAFLIFIIAVYSTGKKNIFSIDVLLTSTIIAPLFLVYGFRTYMGIIDYSITYTFFYALSFCFIFMFFLPFVNAAFKRTSFHFGILKTMYLLVLSVVISFSGTLNGPLLILICASVLLILFTKNYFALTNESFVNRILLSVQKIPPSLRYIFGFTIAVALYSFYVGLNNSENAWDSLDLADKYSKLFSRILLQYTYKLGPVLLLAAVVFNTLIISKHRSDYEGENIILLFKWFGILSAVYLLLLPLGGYRFYRPDIIRYDTIMPVNLGMILFYGLTSAYLFKKVLAGRKLVLYSILTLVIMGIYINADENFIVKKYSACERDAFHKIANSKEKVVLLQNDCTVFDWNKIKKPSDSKYKAKLLFKWNVLKEQKLYYQK